MHINLDDYKPAQVTIGPKGYINPSSIHPLSTDIPIVFDNKVAYVYMNGVWSFNLPTTGPTPGPTLGPTPTPSPTPKPTEPPVPKYMNIYIKNNVTINNTYKVKLSDFEGEFNIYNNVNNDMKFSIPWCNKKEYYEIVDNGKYLKCVYRKPNNDQFAFNSFYYTDTVYENQIYIYINNFSMYKDGASTSKLPGIGEQSLPNWRHLDFYPLEINASDEVAYVELSFTTVQPNYEGPTPTPIPTPTPTPKPNIESGQCALRFNLTGPELDPNYNHDVNIDLSYNND